MLQNLTMLAILILILWAGALAYYFIVSRQQKQISEEIEELRQLLEETEGESGES
jgi:preprotein translocase subunit YajC